MTELKTLDEAITIHSKQTLAVEEYDITINDINVWVAVQWDDDGYILRIYDNRTGTTTADISDVDYDLSNDKLLDFIREQENIV